MRIGVHGFMRIGVHDDENTQQDGVTNINPVHGIHSLYIGEDHTNLHISTVSKGISVRSLNDLLGFCSFEVAGGLTECDISDMDAGVYFLRYAYAPSSPGASTSPISAFVSELNLEGTWVVTAGEINAIQLRTFLVSLIDTLASANPATAIEQFEETYGDFFPNCEDQADNCNEVLYFETIRTAVQSALESSDRSLPQLRAALTALPDVSVTGPLSECEGANLYRIGYLEATYNETNRRYTLSGGETGVGIARTDNGCTWLAEPPTDVMVAPITTDRTITSQELTNILADADAGSVVVIDSPNQFRILLRGQPFQGSSVTMRRLSN